MDKTTEQIVKMLSDERMDRRYAAALVLAELRIPDPSVVDALIVCLSDENRLMRIAALDALSDVRSPEVTKHVLPFLDNPDADLRDRAIVILGNQGGEAFSALLRELQGAPLPRRRTLVSILARNPDDRMLERLLQLLADGEIAEHVIAALRSEIDHMPKPRQEAMAKQLCTLLGTDSWIMDPGRTARTLRLVGYIRDPNLVEVIFPFTMDKKPVPVRLAAVAALRRPLGGQVPNMGAVFSALMRYAAEPEPTLARAAVDTLRGMPLPTDAVSGLLELSKSRHAEARAFALESLGTLGDEKIVGSLFVHLYGEDPVARTAALQALAKMEEAPSILFAEWQSQTDPHRVKLLCDALLSHAGRLDQAMRRTILLRTVNAIEEESPMAPALMTFLSTLEPEGCAEALYARAVSHRAAGRHSLAFSLLCQVEQAGLLQDKGRYEAVVSGLCTIARKQELGRASRTQHPVLRNLLALVHHAYPVASRLVEEPLLNLDDLYYLGFNFAESRDADEQELGGLLLHHVMEKGANTKLAQSARNKLRLAGIE